MSAEHAKNNETDVDADKASWSAIENELKVHDQAMVKDHAEDVDNLLVFAGLFSAVLTAFLVESYTMLQEDIPETNKKLLSRISTQLESFTFSGNFLNSTASAPLPSDTFTPTRAAIWINALWFLSLIFSLSAAFFGIRVRQWLREYMQWNAALAHPRENVHVRQVRFEALQTWKVLGSISVIPGLLELALVFFVSGIVIFLWTLDRTVAITVTLAVFVFLTTASVVTMLPTFLKCCPYKSPTARALVLLSQLVLRLIPYCKHVWTSFLRIEGSRSGALRTAWKRSTFNSRKAPTWRQRDLEGSYIQKVLSKNIVSKASVVFGRELNLVETEYGLARHTARGGGARIKLYDADMRQLTVVSEVSWLSRALYWVMQSSQDRRLHQHALRCARCLQPTNPEQLSIGTLRPYAASHLAFLHLLSRNFTKLFSVQPEKLSLTTVPGASVLRDRLRDFIAMPRRVIAGSATNSSFSGPRMFYIRFDAIRYCAKIGHLESGNRTQSRALAHSIAADLQRLTATVAPIMVFYVNIHPFIELIAALTLVAVHGYGDEGIDGECSKLLVQSFNNCQTNASFIPAVDRTRGVKAAIFEVLQDFSRLEDYYLFDSKGCLRERQEPLPSTVYPDMSRRHEFIMSFVQSHRYRDLNENSDLDDLDDLRVFVDLTREWLETLQSSAEVVPKAGQTASLLREMAVRAELALTRGYMNCGYISDLPWFAGPRWKLNPWNCGNMLKLWDGDLGMFRRFVDVLKASDLCGLLTGDIVTMLPDLVQWAHAPEDICENGDEDILRAWLASLPGPSVDVQEGHSDMGPLSVRLATAIE